MENLIIEIEAYAASIGKTPSWVLREAINAGWGAWSSWCEGKSSPTLRVVDRLRQYMADHPASPEKVRGAA